MVSTVPAYLQNILIGTATRRNDQEWTNFKLHEPCEPHGLSSGVCVWGKILIRRFLRYQRSNPYIEEEQTTQWPKEKVQKDKQ
jgi:hypothetical protein